MSDTTTTLNAIADTAIANGSSLVGAIVGWRFRVGPHAPVTRKAARAVFAQWGRGDAIPESYAAADGLARAAYEVPVASVGAKKDNLKSSKASKSKADTTAAHIVYEKLARDGESGEGWIATGRARVDVAAGVAVALPPEGEAGTTKGLAYAANLAAWANYLVDHVGSRDLSNVLTAIVKQDLHVATVFGEKAGTYFVPASKVGDVERLARDVAPLGISLYIIRQTDASAAPVAAAAATDTFAKRIAELQKRVEEVRTRNVRSDGIAGALAEAASIRDEVAFWESVAGFQADEVRRIGQELHDFFTAAQGCKDAKSSCAGLAAPSIDLAALRGESGESGEDELSPFEI